jgi:hypothetical protein
MLLEYLHTIVSLFWGDVSSRSLSSLEKKSLEVNSQEMCVRSAKALPISGLECFELCSRAPDYTVLCAHHQLEILNHILYTLDVTS